MRVTLSYLDFEYYAFYLENYLLFDFNDSVLFPMHMHTHPGVIFGNYCKWTTD
jgi:hypothetical protein